MGAGISLAVVGAILAFAVDDVVPGVDVNVVGLIFMLAGGAVIAHARRGTRRERVVTRVEGTADSTAPQQTVRETIRERDLD